MKEITFNFLLSKKFKKYQDRIILKKNKIKKSENLMVTFIILNFFTSIISSFLICILFLSFGVWEIAAFFVIFGLLFFLFISPFYKKLEFMSKNENKIKKYKNLYTYTQYKILYDKIDNTNFTEVSNNRDLILNNIENFKSKEQEEILALLNKKIEIEKNSIENIRNKMLDFTKESENLNLIKPKKVIQSI